MKKGILFPLGLLVIISTLVLAAAPILGAGASFSAEMVVTDNKGKQTLGRVYVAPEKLRQEIADAKSGEVVATIVRLDKGVVWTLMPEQKMYMELDFAKAGMMQYAAEKSADLIAETIDLGTETIDAYVCTKTKYVYKDKAIGTSTVWFAEKLQFGIKFESSNRQGTTITEYKQIKEGPQPASLFEIPQGYTKFSLGGLLNLGKK